MKYREKLKDLGVVSTKRQNRKHSLKQKFIENNGQRVVEIREKLIIKMQKDYINGLKEKLLSLSSKYTP
jgi:hypothetical protein